MPSNKPPQDKVGQSLGDSLGAESLNLPTTRDQVLESLQEKLTAEQDARREERFIFIVLFVILFDIVFFSVMDNFGGPLAIVILELLILVPLAQRLGLQEIALIANRLLSRIAGSMTNRSND